nr:protein SIEVE ELEMENT OCCLUSION B-like [Ipomoea batatas]
MYSVKARQQQQHRRLTLMSSLSRRSFLRKGWATTPTRPYLPLLCRRRHAELIGELSLLPASISFPSREAATTAFTAVVNSGGSSQTCSVSDVFFFFLSQWCAAAAPGGARQRATWRLFPLRFGLKAEHLGGLVTSAILPRSASRVEYSLVPTATDRANGSGHLGGIPLSPAASQRQVQRRTRTAVDDRLRAKSPIEEIFQHAYPGVEGVLQGTQGATIPGAQPVANIEKLEVKASLAVDGVLEGLAYITHKVSCELFASHPLAKSVGILKQLPDIVEHSAALKSRFDAINNLIMAVMDVTRRIMEFKKLPAQYISEDQPPLSVAKTHIPTAVYWTIKSIVACAAQLTSLLGMNYE